MTAPISASPRAQRGTTLLEALIAFGVLSLGILTIGRVQMHLHVGSDIARQRSEAVRLAQEDLETLRAFSFIAASAAARSYADIASAVATIDADSGYATNTRYQLQRDVQASATSNAKHVSVNVAWSDRSGEHQRVVLNSIIAGHDPAYSAALGIGPTGTPVKGAFGRSAWIPLAAKDLGNGRSAFKPDSAAGIAYVLDNASGLVTARCSGVDPGLATRDLTSAALVSCEGAATGYLLSGTVRFSLGTPPSAAQATDAPLALSVTVTLGGGTYPVVPSCAGEALKTVTYTSASAIRNESVPIAATAASLGLATWVESGDRYVAYHCVVYPLANGRWSGRTTLAPVGWTIGGGAADRRVCRYSADSDGSGAIDANIEHPADYQAVSGPLAHQNFLVITGSQTCPLGNPGEGGLAGPWVDLATHPHQP